MVSLCTDLECGYSGHFIALLLVHSIWAASISAGQCWRHLAPSVSTSEYKRSPVNTAAQLRSAQSSLVGESPNRRLPLLENRKYDASPSLPTSPLISHTSPAYPFTIISATRSYPRSGIIDFRTKSTMVKCPRKFTLVLRCSAVWAIE
jgi:hypothetical protein